MPSSAWKLTTPDQTDQVDPNPRNFPEELEQQTVERTEHSYHFFNHPATTEIYTLSLHDGLPICIWRAPARKKSAGWWNLLRSRLLSFGMILGIAFLLMVSLVVSALLSALGQFLGPRFKDWGNAAAPDR